MKELVEFKEEIHKCSKCGLCQAECPIYKITRNDCTVSRGQFAMLEGVINNKFKITKTINKYLDLCLKCGACAKFCPSGIDIVDIIISAKYEYFKSHPFEKIKTFFQKYFIFGLIPRIVRTFIRPSKSRVFDKKVLYFGGCGSKLRGDKALVKILNQLSIQVINPKFHCCGIPYFSRGDLNEFNNSIKSYIKILKKYDIKDVVTTCASCEKSLKDYIKWTGTNISEEDVEFLKTIKVKNIYEYLREYNQKLILKNPTKITYHKPCNINNYEDIKWLLENTHNLEYFEMQGYDKCCGLNGIFKLGNYKILKNVFENKQLQIKYSGVKNVTTSCLGCETALNLYSFGQYKVYDLIEYLANRL